MSVTMKKKDQRMYTPNKWVVIHVKETDIYKVLAGWSGGYLDGDSWRMSSGITNVSVDGDYFMIENDSGSVYKCHKDSRGMNSLSSNIYMGIEDKVDLIEDVESINGLV